MQCPNCGRNVRSKNQCAYCGYVFDSQDIKEAKKQPKTKYDTVIVETPDDEGSENTDTQVAAYQEPGFREVDVEYTSEPQRERKGGGIGRVLWGIIKLILAVAIVFLLFLYGPRLIRQVVDMFNSQDSAVQTNQPQDPNNAVIAPGSDEEASQDEQASQVDSEASESGEPATDESSADAGLSMTNSNVNLDNYPVINVTLEFDSNLNTVDRETFDLSVETNGDTIELNDEFSMTKEGSNLNISFNDPSLDVLSTEPQEQTLVIEAPEANFSETITYQLPSVPVDQSVANQFNETINNNLTDFGDVTVAFYDTSQNSMPLVYDAQTTDAGIQISWFVLQRTYDAIENGTLALDTEITVNDALIAEGDEGTVATAEADATFTVQELMNLIVQENDISAINHLIQETGGPNDFNIWLTESNYFATKVNELLSVNESGLISGAVTDVQDVSHLLTNLVNNDLVSETADEQFKEMLLQTPLTNKYPAEGIEAVTRRYEIASADTNQSQQSYAGILETEETNYIIVLFISEFSSAEEVVPAISTTISELMSNFTSDGELEETETGTEESAEEVVSEETTENPQVSVVEEAPVEETFPESDSQAQPQTSPPVSGAGSGQYYQQTVDNTGETVYLPDRSITNENGEVIEPTWYYNAEEGRYVYSFN